MADVENFWQFSTVDIIRVFLRLDSRSRRTMKTAESAARVKRRSFFGLAAVLTAGILAGPARISRITRSSGKTPHPPGRMSVTINPLAVPRTRKGANSNG